MDLESEVMGFQFGRERTISSHEGFYQDCNDEGNTTKRDTFVRKNVALVFGESVEIAPQ